MIKTKYKPCECCGTSIPVNDTAKYCISCSRFLKSIHAEIYYLRKRIIDMGGKFNEPYRTKVENKIIEVKNE